jgi:hypothetical protein
MITADRAVGRGSRAGHVKAHENPDDMMYLMYEEAAEAAKIAAEKALKAVGGAIYRSKM